MATPESSASPELQRQLDTLTETVDMLQRELSELRSNGVPAAAAIEDENPARSRRQMLKLVGGAAVAGVAATALGSSQQAAAATNDPLLGGHQNYAANMTYLAPGTTTNTTTLAGPLTSEPTLFWADNRGSTLANAVGVRGDGRATGFGVFGNNDLGGVGVLGGSATGIGVQAGGGRAAAYLTGAGIDPNTRADAHNRGEIDIDVSGNLWYCAVAGTPGTWRQLGGPSAAGAFHAISPVRAYDSRWTGGTPLVTNSSRIVSVADGHTLAGVVDAANAVPARATAVAYNITITQTVGSGFLSVTPGNATDITTSAINWATSGLNLANGLIVGLDASRQIKVFCGGGGSTDFIVDVNGYFL
ncbi:MAG: hypothetical protein ABI949_04735 [Ilumatobacteraceae bacterium]